MFSQVKIYKVWILIGTLQLQVVPDLQAHRHMRFRAYELTNEQ